MLCEAINRTGLKLILEETVFEFFEFGTSKDSSLRTVFSRGVEMSVTPDLIIVFLLQYGEYLALSRTKIASFVILRLLQGLKTHLTMRPRRKFSFHNVLQEICHNMSFFVSLHFSFVK